MFFLQCPVVGAGKEVTFLQLQPAARGEVAGGSVSMVSKDIAITGASYS
jgi:hypothetical protein